MWFTCDGVGEVLIAGLAQQTHQRRDAVAVLDGNLVVRVAAVRDVLECTTGGVVHLLLWVVQHGDQRRDALHAAHLCFHLGKREPEREKRQKQKGWHGRRKKKKRERTRVKERANRKSDREGVTERKGETD